MDKNERERREKKKKGKKMNGQRLCFSFARRALPAQHRFLNDTFTHIGMQLFLLASISANTEGVEVEGEARPFGAKKKKCPKHHCDSSLRLETVCLFV